MKAKAVNIFKITQDNGEDTPVKHIVDTIFDPSEVFSFTTITSPEGRPEYIEILTKNGISCTLIYEENLIIDLATNFRDRKIL